MAVSKKLDTVDKTIDLEYLARVEGEGSLFLKIENGKVQDAKLRIFEPPRFFEGFLRDRNYYEAPDITSRICGICPIAYQMSSIHAMEYAMDVKLDPTTRLLRRLLYCGEWIESHVLHMAMLHLPDFLGYEDAIDMAKDHKDKVELALKLKKLGNEIVTVLAGREIHPINAKVGGFYRRPDPKEFDELESKIESAIEESKALTRVVGGLEFPDFHFDYDFVSLYHPDEYPMNEGTVKSSSGLEVELKDYEKHYREDHVEHSTSLHSTRDGGIYMTGPLARLYHNQENLSKGAYEVAKELDLLGRITNPFKSIAVRGVEVIYAFEEAKRILEEYRKGNWSDEPVVEVKAGEGFGCTEAPRGILFHRYRIDDKGLIKEAKIVPPTSQNMKMIEDDLKRFAQQYMDLDQTELTHKCEQAVRNYDPCISCSVHFLSLEIERR